jgi:hypothetical protein
MGSHWPDFEISEKDFRAALVAISPFTISEGYRAFYRLYAARSGKSRWGDKTPLYCMNIATIREVLREACFIHVIRDGRDVALSLRMMWFSPGKEIETLAAHWRERVLTARDAGLGSPDYLEIRYEALILDTEETLRQICAFINLRYDDAMLRYYERTPVRLKEHKGRYLPDGPPIITQELRLRQQQRTTEPPDAACVFAWKSRMSDIEKGKFALVAGDLLRDLGYEV